jgi:hypothetical protein
MPLTTAGRNAAADGVAAISTHVGALTALTPTETSGGSYARQAISYAAAASGVKDNSGALTIPINAGETIVALGTYTALSAGTLTSYAQIGSTLRGVGTVVSAAGDAISSNGHGLANTNRVFVSAVAGEALPTGLSATTLYFVVGATTDTFQLSLTSGGSAVDISALGDLAWFRTVPETFGSAGTITVGVGQLDIDMNMA